jgi:hypothetical protein
MTIAGLDCGDQCALHGGACAASPWMVSQTRRALRAARFVSGEFVTLARFRVGAVRVDEFEPLNARIAHDACARTCCVIESIRLVVTLCSFADPLAR